MMQQFAGNISTVRTAERSESFVARVLLGLIWIYQHSLSIVLGPRCRFYPSCSSYACGCLRKYPLPVALMKTSRRLLSCHPFNPGGIDLP